MSHRKARPDLGEREAKTLLAMLGDLEIMGESQAKAFLHALIDIADSLDKVYGEIVPSLMEIKGAQRERIMDRLWDLREEFRHIAYHIEDGGLTEL